MHGRISRHPQLDLCLELGSCVHVGAAVVGAAVVGAEVGEAVINTPSLQVVEFHAPIVVLFVKLCVELMTLELLCCCCVRRRRPSPPFIEDSPPWVLHTSSLLGCAWRQFMSVSNVPLEENFSSTETDTETAGSALGLRRVSRTEPSLRLR